MKSIENIWKSQKSTKTLTKKEMELIIRKKSIKSDRRILSQLYMIGAAQLATSVMMIINIMMYEGPYLIVAWISAIVLAGMFYYSFSLIIGNNNIHKSVTSLTESIRKRVHFYRVKYDLFIIFACVSVLIMNLAISMLTDLKLGGYKINHPLEFTLVQLVAFAIVYISFKVSAKYTFEEYAGYLEDLDKELADIPHEKYSRINRKRRIIMIIMFVIVLSLFLLGLIFWFG